MKQRQPLAPVLPPAQTTDFFLADEQLFDALLAEDFDYSYLTCKNLMLKNSRLEKVVMQKTRLEYFECSNVIFHKCDLANLEAIGASFHQVVFDQCKLTGTNFAESYLRDCRFTNCVANFSSFSNTNLKTVTFTDCELKDSEFYEMTWKNLELKKNQISGSNWFRTPLSGLDFTSNTFSKISLSQENLRGLKVDQEQALVIALGLGLLIEGIND